MTTLRDLIEAGKVSLDTVVLGTLPMTRDGAIVQLGRTVWNNDQWANNATCVQRDDDSFGGYFGAQWRPIEYCYSTRQAAEAAQSAAAKGGG